MPKGQLCVRGGVRCLETLKRYLVRLDMTKRTRCSPSDGKQRMSVEVNVYGVVGQKTKTMTAKL